MRCSGKAGRHSCRCGSQYMAHRPQLGIVHSSAEGHGEAPPRGRPAGAAALSLVAMPPCLVERCSLTAVARCSETEGPQAAATTAATSDSSVHTTCPSQSTRRDSRPCIRPPTTSPARALYFLVSDPRGAPDGLCEGRAVLCGAGAFQRAREPLRGGVIYDLLPSRANRAPRLLISAAQLRKSAPRAARQNTDAVKLLVRVVCATA
jgi:hypothetical protein